MNYSDEEIQAIFDGIKDGMSSNAIGRKLGRCGSSIRYKARKMGLEFATAKVKPKRRENPDRAIRKCLGCATEFDSRWVGNRLCKQCAGAAVRQSGAMA